MRLDESFRNFDPEKALNETLGFIRKVVKKSNASGVVLGMSGGVDSSLTAVLCVRALDKEKVLGILMPTSFTPKEDVEDGFDLAKSLGIRTEMVNIDEIGGSFVKTLKISEGDCGTRVPLANIRARVRMAVLYFYANVNNYLVAGTSDRSEALIGYFTKYGDGGADFLPIRHLFKTQVRKLASYLGVPERMAFKPSSPQLYPGHKISDELPLDYDRLDPVLVGLFDYKLPVEKVSEMAKVPLDAVMEIVRRHKRTEHKRCLPQAIKQ
jgi:NAD+ synthase